MQMLALTGVGGSWSVVAHPAEHCDLSRFPNIEFDIYGSHKDAPYSTFQCPVAMQDA